MATIFGSFLGDRLDGTPLIDFIFDGPDLGPGLLGFNGTDWARDTINAGADDDMVMASGGQDLLFGGADNDTIYGGRGSDRIFGDDEFYDEGAPVPIEALSDGNDTIYGGRGDDAILGQGGSDYIEGGRGDDVILGGSGFDEIFGGAGDDFLISTSTQKDVIYGGRGDDEIVVSHRADVYGEDGDDEITGTGAGRFEGGDGDDVISFSGNAVTSDVFGGDGDDIITCSSTIGARIWGDAGDDLIIGGFGNDQIVAGPGRDEVTGRAGADEFFFLTFGAFPRGEMRITDFVSGEDLVIFLTARDEFGQPITALDTNLDGLIDAADIGWDLVDGDLSYTGDRDVLILEGVTALNANTDVVVLV